MAPRFAFTVALCLCMAGAATAQVVRFQTSVGDFDMVLNPTNNPLLQGQVDNMLQYVNENRYTASWINRAPAGFVLQMGGFYSNTERPAPTVDSVRSVFAFDPVKGHPQIKGLSNTVGTVALALPGGRVTDRDGGTSNFFVNLGDNSRLDTDFTVFAAIPDMTVINKIMALSKKDLTADSSFGTDPGSFAFSDVPLTDDGRLVFIKRAFVISDTLVTTKAIGDVQSAIELSQSVAAATLDDASSSISSSSLIESGETSSSLVSVANVPEPTAFLLATIGLYSLGCARRRRRS
jgi:peptidyl-prolyl cis-trans isomerase A (cyclophilin A)